MSLKTLSTENIFNISNLRPNRYDPLPDEIERMKVIIRQENMERDRVTDNEKYEPIETGSDEDYDFTTPVLGRG